MFNRRAILLSLFAVAVLGTTGCCGRVRNFVYRVRHCPNCAVGFDGPAGFAPAPVAEFAPPVAAGPVGPVGCASCAGGGGMPDHHAGYPMPGGYPVVGQPGMGGPVFTGPLAYPPATMMTPPTTMAPPPAATDKK